MRRLVRHGIVAASLCGIAVGAAVAAVPGTANVVEAVPILQSAVQPSVASAQDERTTRTDRSLTRPRLDTDAVANRADALVKDQKTIAAASTKAKKAAKKAAAEKKAKAERKAEAERKAAEEAAAKAKIPYVAGSSSPKEIAKKVLSDAGYTSNDFSCFNSIITRESGWNVHATNRSSGAYGLPQSLPGSKMASAGSDWRTNPATQVKWAMGYMEARYGGICSAWGYWQSHHNY